MWFQTRSPGLAPQVVLGMAHPQCSIPALLYGSSAMLHFLSGNQTNPAPFPATQTGHTALDRKAARQRLNWISWTHLHTSSAIEFKRGWGALEGHMVLQKRQNAMVGEHQSGAGKTHCWGPMAFASDLPWDAEQVTPFHVVFFPLMPSLRFDSKSFPSDCITLFAQSMHLHNI